MYPQQEVFFGGMGTVETVVRASTERIRGLML